MRTDNVKTKRGWVKLHSIIDIRTSVVLNYLMTASNVGQATVSRSIDQIAPVVRQCIPSNPRCARSSTCESLEHPHHAHEEFNLAWVKPSYSATYVIICV